MDRESLVVLAQLAEQCGRFVDSLTAIDSFDVADYRNGDVVQYITDAVHANNQGPELSEKERIMLSDSLKNIVVDLRHAWRLLTYTEMKRKSGDEQTFYLMRLYRTKIEDELGKYCNRAILLIEQSILPRTLSLDGNIFFRKMLGDYFRYLSEYCVGEKRTSAVTSASQHYDIAINLANSLPISSPLRLSLALNFAVFTFEILGNHIDAIKIAKNAFDQSYAELSTLPEGNYQSAVLILQMLRDNVTLWSSDERPSLIIPTATPVDLPQVTEAMPSKNENSNDLSSVIDSTPELYTGAGISACKQDLADKSLRYQTISQTKENVAPIDDESYIGDYDWFDI
jgi:14-3-3 protein epsilon